MANDVIVSVIIPTYNSVNFLTTAIDSVLAQTFRDFEILVIDDGSTDATEEVLKQYGSSIRYIYKPNGGVSTARNCGIGNAKGKYLAFLDADDFWLEQKLEKQVALMELREDIGLCFAATERFDENMQTIRREEAKLYDDYCEALLLKLNIVAGSCSSVIIRHSIALQTEGFDSNLSTYADWDYWLRLSLVTNFAPLPETLVKYRLTPGSMSSDPFVTKRDAAAVMDKFFNLPDLPDKYKALKNRAISNCLMAISGEFLHDRKVLESVSCMWAALKLYPQNIKKPLGIPVRFLKRRFE